MHVSWWWQHTNQSINKQINPPALSNIERVIHLTDASNLSSSSNHKHMSTIPNDALVNNVINGCFLVQPHFGNQLLGKLLNLHSWYSAFPSHVPGWVHVAYISWNESICVGQPSDRGLSGWRWSGLCTGCTLQ